MKQHRIDAVVHKVTQLIKENADEKSFESVLTTISQIISFDYADADKAHSNFWVATGCCTKTALGELVAWHALYHNS